MTFVDYLPDKHKDRQLYELQPVELRKGVFGWVPIPVKVSHEEATKIPWYYVVEEAEKSTVEKVKKLDIAALLKRQAKEKPLPPLEDDDGWWSVDDAYQEELAARVEAGVEGE